MTSRLSIGQFAKLTHLSVKTLRHYHDADVLAPAAVDQSNGYRYYEHSQAHRAQLVRQLRQADMSLTEIAELLGSEGTDRRERVAAHADELARRASELAGAAAALRTALDAQVGALDIVRRELIAGPALVLAVVGGLDTVDVVCEQSFDRLVAGAASLGVELAGPGVASFADDVFESEGTVTCMLPTTHEPAVFDADLDHDISVGVTPSGVFLTAVHIGERRDVGVTYSALGEHVDQLGVAANRHVVERYLVTAGDLDGLRTEVCWPVIS